MKSSLRFYSDILQLRTEPFEEIRESSNGFARAVKLLIVVGLIAGLGYWIGLPAELDKPVLADFLEKTMVQVDRLDHQVVSPLADSLAQATMETLEARFDEMLPNRAPVLPEHVHELLNQADISAEELGARLAELSGAPEGVTSFLAEQGVTGESLSKVIGQTGISSGRLAQIAAQLATESPETSGLVAQRPAGMLETISALQPGLFAFLAKVVVTPERIGQALDGVAMPAVDLAERSQSIAAMPGQVNGLLARMEQTAEALQPPLGNPASRVSRTIGRWLSTPFNLMASWMFFALAGMLTAKSLGGKGTISQHLAAVALASAPLVLLMVSLIPPMDLVMPVSAAIALEYFGQLLALVGWGWALFVLVKSLEVTHEFSAWRSAATILLTWIVLFVFVPLLSFVVMGYLFSG
ncbi:MAG: Yip1 family protein [Chloroflexota bacterium]|nr:Yip1 family protein [Chloroflexota bacterium]